MARPLAIDVAGAETETETETETVAATTTTNPASAWRHDDAWYELFLNGQKLGYAHQTVAIRWGGIIAMKRDEHTLATRDGIALAMTATTSGLWIHGQWVGGVAIMESAGTRLSKSLPPRALRGHARKACVPAVFVAPWLALGGAAPPCGYDPWSDAEALPLVVARPSARDGESRWELAWQHPWGALRTRFLAAPGSPPRLVASSDGIVAQSATAAAARAAWEPPDLLAITAIAVTPKRNGFELPNDKRPAPSVKPALLAFPGQKERASADGTSWRVVLSQTPLRHVPDASAGAGAGTIDDVATLDQIAGWLAQTQAELTPSLAVGAGLGDCRAMSEALARHLRAHGVAFRYATGWRLSPAHDLLTRHRWLVVRVPAGWISVDPTYDELPAQPRLMGLILEEPGPHPPQGDLVFELPAAPSKPRRHGE